MSTPPLGWARIPPDMSDADSVQEYYELIETLRKFGIEVRTRPADFSYADLVRDEVYGLLVIWYGMNDWTPWRVPGFPVRPNTVYAQVPLNADNTLMDFADFCEHFILPAQKKGADEERENLDLSRLRSPTPS